MDHQFSIGTIFSIPYIFNDFNHHLHCLNDSKCSRRPRTRRHTHHGLTLHTHTRSVKKIGLTVKGYTSSDHASFTGCTSGLTSPTGCTSGQSTYEHTVYTLTRTPS